MGTEPKEDGLENITKLLEEVAFDNTSINGSLSRIVESHEGLRAEMTRHMDTLRSDFTGSLTYRTLRDLCVELIPPLSAMEAMLERADFADPEVTRGHVQSLVITVHGVLNRMGVQKITISVGEDLFDSKRHNCARVVPPEESSFPSAPPRTIVRVLQQGYILSEMVLSPAEVEIQGENRSG